MALAIWESARESQHNSKTEVVVALVGRVVIATGRATVARIVVPRAAPQHVGMPAPGFILIPGLPESGSCSQVLENRMLAKVLAQSPGIPMAQVGSPALDGLPHFLGGNQPVAIVPLQALQTGSTSTQVVVANSNAIWQDSKPDKVSAKAGLITLAFDRMDAEAQGF